MTVRLASQIRFRFSWQHGALALLLLLCVTSSVGASKRLIASPPQIPGQVSFNWIKNDGAGFRWDITSQGTVNDGIHDAYDGGLSLQVNGSSFSMSGYGKLLAGGNGISIGPWKRGSLSVTRQIYIDPTIGYCRWIDLVTNTGNSEVSVPLHYRSNLGGTISQAETSSGTVNKTNSGNVIQKKDWAFVTTGSSSSRPSLVHVFATPQSKIRPSLRWSSDDIYCNFTVKIPPKATVGICLFEMQRRGFGAAKTAMKEFNVNKELAKIPAKTRRLLLNMPSSLLMLGEVGLIRLDDQDTLTLRDGKEHAGTLTNATFRVKTPFGEKTIPAKNVLAALLPTRNDSRIILALKDGQVVSGSLMEETITITPKAGKTPASPIAVPLWKVHSFTYRISPEKPETITLDKPTVTLQKGGQLAFDPKGLDLTFLTEYGRLKLQPDQLAAITLNVPGRVSHQATFRNGSTLSGLLLTMKFTLPLTFSSEPVTLSRRKIQAFRFTSQPPTKEDRAQVALLRNGDTLRGKLLGDSLTIKTQNGKSTIAVKDLATLTQSATGATTLTQHKGTRLTGNLVEKTLPFQITAGPTLKLYIGHLTNITFPKPKPKPKVKPKPKPKPPTPPASPEIDAIKKKIAVIKARNLQSQAKIKALSNDPAAKRDQNHAQLIAAERAKLAEGEAMLKNLQAQLDRAKSAKPTPKPATTPTPPEIKALKAQMQTLKTAIEALTKKSAEATQKAKEMPIRAVARRRIEEYLKKIDAQLADQQAQLKNLQAQLGLTQAGEAMKRLSNERSTHYPCIN